MFGPRLRAGLALRVVLSMRTELRRDLASVARMASAGDRDAIDRHNAMAWRLRSLSTVAEMLRERTD